MKLLAVVLLLATAIVAGLAEDINIGNGFVIKDNAKGFTGEYKNSDFDITLTCVREVDGTSTVKEANLATATTTSTEQPTEAGGQVVIKTLTWEQPADAAGSLVWKHKLYDEETFLESVSGADDNVTVQAGDLKGLFTFNWTPTDYSNQLQVCVNVAWDIAVEDIVTTVIDSGGIPNLDYNDIKDDEGNNIGFEITGDLSFKFYWPGKVRYEINANDTYTLGSAEFTTENLDKNLNGQVDVIITFEKISDRVIIDPVTSLSGDASTIMHMAVLLLAFVLLVLSVFI